MGETCPYCNKRQIIRTKTCGHPICKSKHNTARSLRWVHKFRIGKKERKLEHALIV
jgi:hypothetical protein